MYRSGLHSENHQLRLLRRKALDSVIVIVPVATFVAVSVVAYLAAAVLQRDPRVAERLEGLSDGPAHAARRAARRSPGSWSNVLSKLGARLLPDNEAERTRVHKRLIHAGVYSPSAPGAFLAAKAVFGVFGPSAGLALALLDLADVTTSLLVGALVGATGLVAPGLWLDWRKARRQRTLRGSLPDFLDLIVTCMEGGLSFEAALQRVTDEMQTAHPLLAAEMRVVQRETHLGSSIETALRNFASRSDLDVGRSLATVVEQARRFGSRMAEALRVHSDTLRYQREQRAEENAQKATVKILFPTLLFIFPPVLVVLGGPAVIQIQEKFSPPAARAETE